ncbi:helix-turn-helix domain-containing protein [Shewanella sp.]
MDRNTVLALYYKGSGATEIARQLNIARSTVYKVIKDSQKLLV